MKLLWSSRSPFARKVMVAAHELGIVGSIEVERVVVATDVANAGVLVSNPLGQIPTLIRDDGTALFDSRVIIDFLNATYHGVLVPPAGEPRWTALRLEALGDGLAQLNRGRLAEARRGERASLAYDEAFRAKSASVLDGSSVSLPPGQMSTSAPSLSLLRFPISISASPKPTGAAAARGSRRGSTRRSATLHAGDDARGCLLTPAGDRAEAVEGARVVDQDAVSHGLVRDLMQQQVEQVGIVRHDLVPHRDMRPVRAPDEPFRRVPHERVGEG